MPEKKTWTGDDVQKILSNPLTCLGGVHPFCCSACTPKKALISEEQFIEAAVKAIETEGARKFIRAMLDNLKDPSTYGWAPPPPPDPTMGSGHIFSEN